MKIAIRFEGPTGPLVLECTRRDYPASYELPALIRKHARGLGVTPTGDMQRVLFLNREVRHPRDLLEVDAGKAQVVCAKLGAAPAPQPVHEGVLLAVPKVAS